MATSGKPDPKSSIESWSKEHLARFAQDYGNALTRYFAKRGASENDIDDFVQTVFIRLASRAAKGEVSNPEAYLMQTANSVWMDHLRRKQRKGEHEHLDFDEAYHSPEGFTPERVLVGREAITLLKRALGELPEQTRHIYLLCRLDGLKRKEVAERFGITVSAVDKHLMNASKHVGLALGRKS